MQSVGPTGFYNLPATKFLVLFVASCSIAAAVFNKKIYFHLQLNPHIFIHHQFWRLITSHCAFVNSGDVFFASILFYSMRTIERQYGSAKYVAFIFITLLVSTLLELGALVAGENAGIRYIPAGPYALLFSILYQYHRIIPSIYRFRVFGITMNDKLLLYVLALQMAFSQSFETLIPCICGVLAGAFYRSDIGNIKQWRFPKVFQSVSARFIDPFLASRPSARSTSVTPTQRPIITGLANVDNLMTTGIRNRRTTRAGTQTAVPSPSRSSVIPTTTATEGAPSVREYFDTLTARDVAGTELQPPSARHTRILIAMFPDHPRENITRALSSSHNNLNRAVEILLSTPTPNRNDSSLPSSSRASN
ncbi:hypothetical protein K501DRAFT_252894 [Backusella circina FSU 941]|nr:hypothetical protein K501DRAFT_252894 [Backusella circina FSU 941]